MCLFPTPLPLPQAAEKRGERRKSVRMRRGLEGRGGDKLEERRMGAVDKEFYKGGVGHSGGKERAKEK